MHLKSGHFSRNWSHACDLCCLIPVRYKEQAMRFHAKSVWVLLLLCVVNIPPGFAQRQGKPAGTNGADRVTRKDPDSAQKPTGPGLLSPSEGLAILGAALDSHEHRADTLFDCSHFVHGLYERAGFPFQYASSSDLYEGTGEFRRVAIPQPGDLAVWRGHAGIVVNPAQHTFFSVLHSGPGVDSYDSPYWKKRGQPRFFRYFKPAPAIVPNTSIRTASWKPTVLNNAAPDESIAERPESYVSENLSKETVGSAKAAESLRGSMATPRALVVNSVRPKPDQIKTAFLQACADSDETLRGYDLLNSALVVFDHFEVMKVHITGKRGWAEVQITELLSLTRGKAEVRKRSEKQRWSLSRDDIQNWTLTPSHDAIYLPQHTAEHLLSRELAQLAEDTSDDVGGTQQKIELARLLEVLFEK